MGPDAKEIKARIDIVEYLASLGIELKPVGAGGEYRGLCPFHDEAAPSFQVNRRKGLWHCFGCGAGGDVISFVMKREGVSFREALAILAGPAGLRELRRPENAGRGCIFCAAADYWHKSLGGSTSARRYIERRCIGSAEIVERYVFKAVDCRTRDGFRDLVILKLLYNTGARASEVAAIKICDLDLDDLQVTITGKGNKRRLCGLWKTTAALIRIYLASERRTPRRGYEEGLFISEKRRPLTRYGIYDIVKRHARKAADKCPSLAKKKVSPHTFRHTTGVHLVEAGVDLNTIREWLGHEHLSTTETYARANLRMKRSALARLEQLDRKLVEEITASRGAIDVDPGIGRWLDSLPD